MVFINNKILWKRKLAGAPISKDAPHYLRKKERKEINLDNYALTLNLRRICKIDEWHLIIRQSVSSLIRLEDYVIIW